MEEIILLKIIKFFLENPYDEVYLRELAKKVKISPYAAKKYVDYLVKEKIISDEKKANLRYLKANMNDLFFKKLKIAFSVRLLVKSGLIKFLKDEIRNISSITLFGSTAKGEDDKKSDIDLIIIGKEKHINLDKIENFIGKKINYHIFSWNEWNKNADKNKAFYYDIIANGIALSGELPIVK